MLERAPTAGAGPALSWPQRWRSHSRICSGDQVSHLASWPFCAVATSSVLPAQFLFVFTVVEAAVFTFLGEELVHICSGHPSDYPRHGGHSRRGTFSSQRSYVGMVAALGHDRNE